jgi:thioredoxin 2
VSPPVVTFAPMDTTRTCPSCGAQNRIPPRHLADTGKCGACKSPLGPTATPLDVDVASFDRILGEARVPVLVDFWAAWCGPCRMAAPEVKKVAADMAGRALVLKVDTDRHPELAARYGVRGIPNFAVFREGRLVHQQAGLVGRDVMRGWIERA